MRCLCIILVLCVSCSTGGSADPEAAIRDALALLATGIDREDPILASTPIGTNFFLDPNVASRYGGQWSTETNRPAQGRFREFLNLAFQGVNNTSQTFTIETVDVNGDIATVD